MIALGPIAVGVEGTSLTGTDRERLMHPLVGIVILFSANYEAPGQLIRLCREIHALRDPPLLIAVDHEGGRVQRFRSVEEMSNASAVTPADGSFERFVRLCARLRALSRVEYPRGVFKFRTLEEAQSARHRRHQ